MRILLTPEDNGALTATCLDYYFVGMGANPKEAVANLGETMQIALELAEERGDHQYRSFKPAPAECWDEYWAALNAEREDPPETPHLDVSPALFRPRFGFAAG